MGQNPYLRKMTSAPPTTRLVLHFDVNKTVIMTDVAGKSHLLRTISALIFLYLGGKSLEDMLNSIVAGSFNCDLLSTQNCVKSRVGVF